MAMNVPTVVITRMRPEESDAAARMIAKVIESVPYYSGIAKTTEMGKYTPQLLAYSVGHDPDSVLIARDRMDMVGFCISRVDDGLLWLAWVGVVADWRRSGVASKLLVTVEGTTMSRGCHKMWCDCRTSNVASQGLLTCAGFHRICEVKNHWYGHDFILWEKTPTSKLT
jgi:ribosomal protein S18 acetylase RimI-like enzyme